MPEHTTRPPAWWTVDQARRWITHRDPERKLQMEMPEPLARPDPWNETAAESDAHKARLAPMLAEMREAGQALKRAVAHERVRARGIREPGADPEPIPAETMANPAVTFGFAGDQIMPDHTVLGWERLPLPLFRGVMLQREDVLAEWPARAEAPPPSYSPSALRAALLARAVGWPKGARYPTEIDDLAWAREHFRRAVPRPDLREARRHPSLPLAWRSKGPRGEKARA